MKRNSFTNELIECKRRYDQYSVNWAFLNLHLLIITGRSIQFQVENVRNYEKMLQAARNLRVEREKEHTLAQQKLEQKNQVINLPGDGKLLNINPSENNLVPGPWNVNVKWILQCLSFKLSQYMRSSSSVSTSFISLIIFVWLQFVHSDQRYQRMQQQLKDMRTQGVGTTGAGKQ